MYRNKKDVDKHVENLLSKLSVKEFKSRAYSVARLYFEVGDYANCQKYVEQYLTQKDNNAAAYKLLGQALQKLGQKDRALEHYKTSLDIDPTQTSTILDICELLADDDLVIEPGRGKYWCEKAEATFPKHPVTFRLRERLINLSNPDPEALVKLLTAELAARPKDASLHARLLKHYLNINKYKEAFEHSCNIEFSVDNFINNYAWYEILDDLLKHNIDNVNSWLYQLLLLTVKERICVLSLTETPSGSSKSLVESNELLHAYDQALEKVAKAGAPSGYAEFHASLLQHHRGQFAFHAATFLLKKARKDQLSWRDATKAAAPLMLFAWQTVPLDSKVNWLKHAPEKLLNAVNRWYTEGTFRCSQSGHYLITNYQDKNQTFLDQISQCCSGSHWKDKLYEKIFTNRAHLAKIKSSHFVSNAFNAPVLRLPRKIEVEAYDGDAQRQYGNSLHHFVWTLLNYKNYAHFKCSLFDMLTPTITNCGPETLNNLDMHAFLYCAAYTSCQQKVKEASYMSHDKPSILPANITDLLCTLPQMKWWDCAYKFSQNVLGTELTDIRTILSRGMEVVRCIDNHGLDAELLCMLGRVFSERAKTTTSVEEKNFLELRAGLYYKSAIPQLEKLKNKMMVKVSDKRMFDYTHKELGTRELNSLIEESKLYVSVMYLNDCEYEKAIDVLSNVKSAQAYYRLAQTYKKIAQDEINTSSDGLKTKNGVLLAKAKDYAYKALDMLKDTETNKNSPLYIDTQELIEEIEVEVNKIDPDLSGNNIDGKYSSDENVSYRSEQMRPNNHMFRNISSTPKAPSNVNNTNYRTAMDSQILEMSRMDQQHLERIEHEMKSLQKRDSTISDFMEQTKDWFEENRKLGTQIISTINSNIQNTTDQFKLLKISVDQVKDQIDECRNECKDVGDIKKQIAELKKEVHKLKKSSEQTVDGSDLYNLEDDYRTNESAPTYAAQLPYTPQMLPQFNQRPPFPMPPNPYQLYNQSLYNLYNQYSQFAQTPSVPGAPPLFDATRAQMNYSGAYPTPDQMYLDVAHLIPPSAPAAPTVPVASTIPTMPVAPTLPSVSTMPPKSMASVPQMSTPATPKPTTVKEAKETPRSLPVNVVITSSDPLPTCVSAPAAVLSVTIPPKHIKGTPHNYQIQMPAANESKIMSPPVFSFSMPETKNTTATITSSMPSWKQAFQSFGSEESPLFKAVHEGNTSLDNSKSVVDGPFYGSPNTSLNKSRTLSEKSNTSVENYDPCPDFKPIIPLPAEIKVTTGEEDEKAIFSARAKLYRFVDKQWKERGLGEMKLLQHKITGKVRVLMRREQVHKICANHIITSDMEIKPLKNESKAYFWVANDFADETVVLEKFSVRFKTADVAKDFYDAFEKARLQSKTASPNTSSTQIKTETKSEKESSPPVQIAAQLTTQGKTTVGGFTFSSTPIFKPVEKNNDNSVVTTDSGSNKTNVFSGLSFKSNASSPFSNLFSSTSNLVSTTSNTTEKVNTNKTKLNSSDTVEEFEPTVEFKPVIPLPALVDQKTGEEEENILFEHRAKLLRYDSNTKEWKERGLGNIKLLVHKDTQKSRLLMRREQIMKVCCNHAVTKDIAFQKMPNMDKAVTWCAKDFSEGELVTETFCLRFKTVQACDDFITAIKSVQSKIKDDSKAAKEEQNAAKQINHSGFGEKFKPKAGSWYCEMCYTNNLENFTKCACCEQARPQTSDKAKEFTAATATKTTTTPTPTPTPTSSWGDKFKPKLGSWECQSCFVRNEANLEICSACNSSKDPKAAKSVINLATESAMKFSFGIPSQTAASIQATSNLLKSESISSNIPKSEPKEKTTVPSAGTGFGDKFKPKEGSWECKQCFVRNDGSAETCLACNSPKDPNAPKKNTGIFDTPGSGSGANFRFGIPPAPTTDTPKADTASIFDGTGANKFSFGIPTNTPTVAAGEQKPTAVLFAAPKKSETETPINFSMKKTDDLNKTPVAKPALLPTPQLDSSSSFASKESGSFGFVFKPTTSAKSPAKSPKSPGNESDGEEDYAKEEDCSAHFNPVIPMPDKVEVVTGEENETALFDHRARLYRFAAGDWKERGTGIVKVLIHNKTSKLRVVMRREQVLKICLNHALTPETIYTPKDERSWLFVAHDFSEGELSLQQLCLRFPNKEVALQFKETVDNIRQGNAVTIVKMKTKQDTIEKDEDLVFVSETQATPEEKQKAKELMLPENFYTYKHKTPCKGCRGCGDGEDTKPETSQAIKALLSAPLVTSSQTVVSTPVSTPIKSSFPTFQSPANSVYGTPGNMEKTFDTSIFRTPLGSSGSNTKSSTPSITSNEKPGSDATNKENVFTQKPSIFGNFGEQKSIFGTPQSSPVTMFGGGDSQSAAAKSFVIAPPKLSTVNTPSENKSPDPKAIFASAQATPMFGEVKSVFGNSGVSANKSIFGFSADNQKEDSNSEVKSIFGGNVQKPMNVFSGAVQGSLFGPGSIGNQSNPATTISFGSGVSVFGSGENQNNVFNSIFSNKPNNQGSIWNTTPDAEQQTDASAVNNNKAQESKEDKSAEPKAESIFKVDNTLSFAALSTSEPKITAEKKSDFQWEGAGQQLFTTSQKTPTKGEGAGEEAGAGDEEYDPHYEPIVPLPDKIVVTTGEEDEEKLFSERCKLYRYDDKTREWKERGVGEMKILYHPTRNTYRLLMRREQVHKAVLNMLLFMELELLPMKNSDRAWTWVGCNFAETAAGEQETLAVRFKSVELANSFRDQVVQCVRKLQAAAAKAIREEQEAAEKVSLGVTPLRLPKHLADSARADHILSASTLQQTPEDKPSDPKTEPNANGDAPQGAPVENKQVHFQEPEQEQEQGYDEYEHYEQYDDYEQDYEAYYNEEDDENAFYACEAEAVVQQGAEQNTCEQAHVQVLFDHEVYSPKILVTDAATGEILADMLIHTETEFSMNGDSCSWSGKDYTSNEPIDKSVTLNFYDSESAMNFYDSCETSKGATYSSNEPES